MESNNHNENREAKSKGKAPRPPTRLQKHAPAALQLDLIANAGNINDPNTSSSTETSSCCAIPLLSPLILSPLPSQEGVEKQSTTGSTLGSDDEQGSSDNDTISTSPQSNGWQHPAEDALQDLQQDSSMLFTFFQSQCVLVDHVQ